MAWLKVKARYHSVLLCALVQLITQSPFRAQDNVIESNSISQLVAELNNNKLDDSKRIAAAIALVGKGEKGVRALCGSLASDVRAVRDAAKVGMERIGSADIDYAPVLLEALRDARHSVRYHCERALVRIGKDSLPLLLRAIDDKDQYLRRSVVWVIGEIRVADTEACKALSRVLKESNTERWNDACRAEAATAIGKLSQTDNLCKEALTALCDSVSDKRPEVRARAVWALGKLGSRAAVAVSTVLKAVNDKDTEVRLNACRSLGQVGTRLDLVVPALAKVVRSDPDESVRTKAAEALGALGSEAAPGGLEALLAGLTDEAHSVRVVSCKALGSLGKGGRGALLVLEKLARGAEPTLAKTAADAIANIKSDSNK